MSNDQPKVRRRVLLAGATLIGVGLAAMTVQQGVLSGGKAGAARQAALQQPAAGQNNEPLTKQEAKSAQDLAMVGEQAFTAPGKPAMQLLFADRHDDKADTSGVRRADVYMYDYTKNQAVVRTVNLRDRKVERSSSAPEVQPPPAAAESNRAAEMLIADPKVGPGVKAAYKKAAGNKELTSAGQLRVRGLIFLRGAAEGSSQYPQVAKCGVERCLQLFIQLPDGKWLNASRVVFNMSTEQVHVLG